jgi:Uma2 family endonuclease
MSRHPPQGHWTYAEFSRLPEDGNRYEVIAGDLYVTPSPRPRHQWVVGNLDFALQAYVRSHDLGRVYIGPIDVLFAEGDYLAPDLVFIRKDRLDIVSERGLEAAPDLVVEVLSPSTAGRDRILKRDRYLHFGVPEYWAVDPNAAEVLVFRSTSSRSRHEISRDRLVWQPSSEAPPLSVDVSALFQDRP